MGHWGEIRGGYSGVIRVLQRVNEKMVENISLRRQEEKIDDRILNVEPGPNLHF